MIAVFADDFTGAAEIAGLTLRHQLSVEICRVVKDSNADVLIISADTRSMDETKAVAVTKEIITALMQLKPTIIYKKIDSVLRGHILPEIKMQSTLMKVESALIVPANPSLGRTIKNGQYYYHDQPIQLSSFANDPEFAIKSSDVKDMIRSNGEVVVCKKEMPLPANGIFIAEVENENDLNFWAEKIDDHILPVGGGDFYSALLSTKVSSINHAVEIDSQNEMPMLFVCGTTFKKSVDSISLIKKNGGPISFMPGKFANNESNDKALLNVWVDETLRFLVKNNKAVMAIDPTTVDETTTALSLRGKMAMAVKILFEKTLIKQIVIEGGSTAAALISELALDSFQPVAELKRGVVKMKVKDKQELYITVKPGSYDWPAGLWNFEQTNN